MQAKQQSAVAGERRAQVGAAKRSEKIRTYNWKDNRCTDHRLGLKFPLQSVMDGELTPIIDACIAKHQQESIGQSAQSLQ